MVSSVWTTNEKTLHINVLKLEAIHRAMIYWLQKLMGLTVLVVSDNSIIMSYINKLGTAVQTDQEATPHVSGQPDSAPGMTHLREIERSCRHPVLPCPDVRYRIVFYL